MRVSEQIIEVINDLCDKFGIAIDWTAENILPYIESLCVKFINYEIYTSLFWIVFMCALSCLMWIITGVICFKSKKEECRFDSDYFLGFISILGVVVSSIISFATIIVVGCQVYDIVVAKTFPEKTIYDYIVNLIETSKN